MKKTLTLLFVALFAANSLFADDVSVQQALQIANQFKRVSTVQTKVRKAPAAATTPTLAYTVKSSTTGKDNVYVINYGNDQGFVVVSGEDGTAADILGYCDHGAFSYAEAPIQMKELLGCYSVDIDLLRENPELAVSPMRKAAADMGTVEVEPLLTTQWNQWAPYNNLCPEGCPTGCVPTAIAQVMYYWRWPDKTMGEVQGVDFSGRSYDWDNMLSNYEEEPYDAVQAQAVAQLMADIGKVYGARYSSEGTKAGLTDYFMVLNFGYEPGSVSYTDEIASKLTTHMIEELNERRPILYSGYPENEEDGEGHALVVDGYTSNNYFHFNFGWGGYCDGFYKDAIVSKYAHHAQIFTKVRPWNAEYADIGDIQYALLGNGEAQVYDYLKTGVENVELEIPATVTYNDKTYKVTRICKHAFYRKGHFSKLTLGENVEAIDPFSFIYSHIDELVLSDKMEVVPDESFMLTYVKTLTIGASVKHIGNMAFYMCPLTNVTSKSPAFSVGDNAFSHSGPDGDWLGCITSLGKEAFSMTNFKNTPEFTNLVTVDSMAFASCSFPDQTFKIPAKLKHIAPDAFWGNNVFFEIDEKNPYFKVQGYQILYNNNYTSLVLTGRPNADLGETPLAFPPTVIRLEPGSITNRARYGSSHGVLIPNTIEEMEGAFSLCESMGWLTCQAIVPPVITDATFNDKLFENSPEVPLYVPEGTAELYRNAPGWRRFTNIRDNEPYVPSPAPQGRVYYMVLHRSGGQDNVIVPVTDIQDMHVDEATGKPIVVLSRNGKDDISVQALQVDSITWMNGFVFENAEVFNLNEENLTAEAQKCTVTLDPTTIDGDVQLSIRNSVLTPNAIDDCTRGVAVDVSLSNGVHDLSGTAQITIPIKRNENERACAAYFNEETAEWEPVMFKYDEEQEAVVITTDHLSLFSAFFIQNPESAKATLRTYYEEYPLFFDPLESMAALRDIVSDPDIEKKAISEWKDNYGFWQSIGIDGGWNLLQALGLESEAIGHATDVVGYLGTAASIFDVINADLKGDNVGVAAGTLKTILSYASGQMASAIGTGIMQASMGCVAFIGVALEHFGTMVQERKRELYNEAYRLYYSKRSDEVLGTTTSKYGTKWRYTHKDWYDYFYPAFEKGMNENRLKALIEAKVRDYCDRFWEDTNAQAACVAEAKAWGLSTWMFPDEATRKAISDAYFADLMAGDLVSVFEAIKNNLATQAGKRYNKAMKGYLDMMNTTVVLYFVDSSCKEGETSKYANWWVRFSDKPLNGNENQYKRYITEQGRASMGVTLYSLALNKMKNEITLSTPEEVDKATYKFSIPRGEGKLIVTIDLATGGVEVEAPELKNLELVYDPEEVPSYYEMWGKNYFEEYEVVASPEWGIPLNGIPTYKHTRFQTELEKFFQRHDFIVVDKSGNIKIGDDIVGKFEGEEGFGKFTINTSYPFVEKTLEQYANALNNENEEMTYRLDNLLNGTLKHKIDCEFKVVRNADGETYTVTFTGKGTYTLNAEIVDKVDNLNEWEYIDLGGGASTTGLNLPGPHHITAGDITTRQVEGEGEVELKYVTKMR
jgi:hypothetical protein